MLLPDKKHKLLTNIKRRNLNPRWNEVFAFEGQYSVMWIVVVGWTGMDMSILLLITSN